MTRYDPYYYSCFLQKGTSDGLDHKEFDNSVGGVTLPTMSAVLEPSDTAADINKTEVYVLTVSLA